MLLRNTRFCFPFILKDAVYVSNIELYGKKVGHSTAHIGLSDLPRSSYLGKSTQYTNPIGKNACVEYRIWAARSRRDELHARRFYGREAGNPGLANEQRKGVFYDLLPREYCWLHPQ